MINERAKKILSEIPASVKVVAAIKGRTADEVLEAIASGIEIVGDNYVQEAEKKFELIGRRAQWHFIGQLQTNKVKRAVKIFDLIQTLDSLRLAALLDKECAKIEKIMPVMIEVNIAGEKQKSGLPPGEVVEFIGRAIEFKNLKLVGLMTMGSLETDPTRLRPQFRAAKELFDKTKEIYKDRLEWNYLSMGMSESYKPAIAEGANMIRLGTVLFGPRG